MKLDPESRSYKTNLAYVLLNNRRGEEAREVVEKLQKSAGSPEEQRAARSILGAIEEEEEWEKESAEQALGRLRVDGPQAAAPDLSADVVHPAISRRQLGPPEWMAVEGTIGAIDCSHGAEVTMTLNLPKGPMDFHAADLGRVGVSGISAESVPDLASCKQWSGRRVKVWFRLVPGEGLFGGDYSDLFLLRMRHAEHRADAIRHSQFCEGPSHKWPRQEEKNFLRAKSPILRVFERWS